MSSDVVLGTTVGVVTAAAAVVGTYFALSGSGEEPDTDAPPAPGCVFATPVPNGPCDCASGVVSLTALGQSSNPSSCPKSKQSTQPCSSEELASCVQDCQTSPWSEWSACNCNLGGVSTRTRTVTKQGSGQGAACVSLAEQKPCDCEPAPPPPGAPDCRLAPGCTEANPCNPVLNTANNQWECKFRCNQDRRVACNPLSEEEVCAVGDGAFGDFFCSSVCDLERKPGCVRAGCCKAADGCTVLVEQDGGLASLETVQRGDWYCEDPCVLLDPLTCLSPSEESVCALGASGRHERQCVSKCRNLTRPAIAFSEKLTCEAGADGQYSWVKSSMCAGKPLPVCPGQARTAATAQCVLNDAALAAGTSLGAYTEADFDWKCISPCGVEPPCATVAGLPPMVCAQDPLNLSYQWSGTCIRNTDVERCRAYPCGSNQIAFCTASDEWTACVSTSCRPNPNPAYSCPKPTLLTNYIERCDPVTNVVTCQQACLPAPPVTLVCANPDTHYKFCDPETKFQYVCRPYEDLMCTAAKPGADFRCVPGTNGWGWVAENAYLANRRDYINYITAQGVYAPNLLDAVNADTGATVMIVCRDALAREPIAPTIGVGCSGNVKVAKALETAIGNPIGNLELKDPTRPVSTPGNLIFYPLNASLRKYYRPNRNVFDLVCPLIGVTVPTCSNNGDFVQSSPYNPTELSSATKPYSGSVEGSCFCRPGSGFVGSNCQFSNTTTCNSKGTVDPITGKCSCLAGFAGAACTFDQNSRCGEFATGITTTSDGSYACVCPTDFSGINFDGKPACLKKDARLLSDPFCSAPCGVNLQPQITQPAGYCDPAVGTGVSCSTLASQYCTNIGSVACQVPRFFFPRVVSGMTLQFNNMHLFYHPSSPNPLYLDPVTKVLSFSGFKQGWEVDAAGDVLLTWRDARKALKQRILVPGFKVLFANNRAFIRKPDGVFFSLDPSLPWSSFTYIDGEPAYLTITAL